VMEQAEVKGIEEAGKGFAVATAAGTLAARDVLVATNGYTGPVVAERWEAMGDRCGVGHDRDEGRADAWQATGQPALLHSGHTVDDAVLSLPRTAGCVAALILSTCC